MLQQLLNLEIIERFRLQTFGQEVLKCSAACEAAEMMRNKIDQDENQELDEIEPERPHQP